MGVEIGITTVNTGAITSTAGTGSELVYTPVAVVGKIQKIWFDFNDTSSTGSIVVTESGTGDVITVVSGFSADTVKYPRVQPNDINGVDYNFLSGGVVPPVVAGPLRFELQNTGSPTTIDEITVYVER